MNDSTVTIIVAPNGWGKSRLLNSFSSGAPNEGSVLHQRHPNGNLFAFVEQTIDCPTIASRVDSVLQTPLVMGGASLDQARTQVMNCLTRFDMEWLHNSDIKHLCGGEDRIVRLIAGMLRSPARLILDDPLGMLDAKRARVMQDLLADYIKGGLEREYSHVHLIAAFSDPSHEVITSFTSATDALLIGEPQNNSLESAVSSFCFALTNNARGTSCTLRLNDISLHAGERFLICHRSYELVPGKVYVLTGPNACGKSLLLKAIAGKLPHGVTLSSGQLSIGGHCHKGRTSFSSKPHILLVPQDSTRLLTSFDAFDMLQRMCASAGEALAKEAQTLLTRDVIWSRRVTESSVAESRFVTVLLAAVATITNPQISWLLVDEPDAYMDREHKRCLNCLLQAVAEAKKGVIVVSHAPDIYTPHDAIFI